MRGHALAAGQMTANDLVTTSRHLLAIPRFRLNTYGRRAFSVAGPMAREDTAIGRDRPYSLRLFPLYF